MEDDPIAYNDLEGTIPPKQYGAGEVISRTAAPGPGWRRQRGTRRLAEGLAYMPLFTAVTTAANPALAAAQARVSTTLTVDPAD